MSEANKIPMSEFECVKGEGLLIPLPTPANAKKTKMKIVEVTERGCYIVTIYKYQTKNYGYTVTPKPDSSLDRNH